MLLKNIFFVFYAENISVTVFLSLVGKKLLIAENLQLDLSRLNL